MNDRILELYCSVDEPQHLVAFTVSFLTLPPLTFKSLEKTTPKSFSDAAVLYVFYRDFSLPLVIENACRTNYCGRRRLPPDVVTSAALIIGRQRRRSIYPDRGLHAVTSTTIVLLRN